MTLIVPIPRLWHMQSSYDIPKASETENSSKKTKSEETSKPDKPEEKQDEDSKKLEEEKEEDDSEQHKVEAATRIQAAFRGHHARKSMKETEASKQQTGTNSESEPTKEQLQEEFRADDKELCNAATKIQASFRGHMSRKEQAASALAKTAGDIVENAASKIEQKVEDAVNELEGIDLTDPDLHKAATKIQASFRGHKVRQEVSVTPTTEGEDKK
ncbi:hypothetical protein KPH14_007896 [Odynerus spinipes]|uniref:Neuromodulin n=1 Tax=Odynerus spinipes TaxID=1348599 RepID=A0AAD9VWI0_9HYME|nr:hypothetical protein KPH14_007896 [Odynerus spinipes]